MIRLSKVLVVVLALAVLFGMATGAMAAENLTLKGTIKTITADKNECVVTCEAGKAWTFTMDEKCKIQLADKEVKLNELKEGDEVEVTYEKKDEKMICTAIKAVRK